MKNINQIKYEILYPKYKDNFLLYFKEFKNILYQKVSLKNTSYSTLDANCTFAYFLGIDLNIPNKRKLIDIYVFLIPNFKNTENYLFKLGGNKLYFDKNTIKIIN